MIWNQTSKINFVEDINEMYNGSTYKKLNLRSNDFQQETVLDFHRAEWKRRIIRTFGRFRKASFERALFPYKNHQCIGTDISLTNTTMCENRNVEYVCTVSLHTVEERTEDIYDKFALSDYPWGGNWVYYNVSIRILFLIAQSWQIFTQNSYLNSILKGIM